MAETASRFTIVGVPSMLDTERIPIVSPPKQRQQEQEEEKEEACEEEEAEVKTWQRSQRQGQVEHKKRQQQPHQPGGDTSSTCDFCASRKRRCDGLLPRYSICIDKNKPRCYCPRNHPAESKSNAVAAARLKHSTGAGHSNGPAYGSSDVGMIATPPGRMASRLSDMLPLKRCRLGPSPATGLVGMQENAFLNDFFGCFGFLPLASASTARQAMVNIMLAPKPQQRDQGNGIEPGNLERGRRKGIPPQRKERSRGTGLACQDRVENSSRCILWCAIALGALLKGSPLSFVAGYVRLAQDSLSECFDGTTVETARAYLAMAFLCRFLGDQEKNEEYIAFARSIVDRLPAEEVPSDMDNMLLVWEEEYRVINYSSAGSGIPVNHTSNGEGDHCAPPVKAVVNERDLCNIILLADRRMNRDIWQGMDVEGTPANIRTKGQKRQGGNVPDEGMGRGWGTFKENVEWGEVGEVREETVGGPRAALQSKFPADEDVGNRGYRVTPPNKVSTETLIADVLPELERISRVIERSGMCSGVGGIFYHSVMAYTNIVKGERRIAFQSITVCTRVMTEFPGICRYRPHLVHCLLLALASTLCPVTYEAMREVYNSILPENRTPAPPLEDWGGMAGICNNVFCRSFEISTNYVGFGPRDAKFDIGPADSRTAPSVPSFGLQAPSVAEGTHGSSSCLACGAEGSPWSASKAGTNVAQQPQSDNDVHPPSQTHPQPCYSQQKVDVATVERLPTDATARVVPLDSLESEELSVSSERHFETGAISSGCRVSAHCQEQTSDVVDVDLRGCFFEEETPQDRRQTVTVPAGSADLGAALVSGNVSCDIGVENVDGSAVNDLTGCELSFFGEERDDDDLCLSEGYLMDAVDALMASPPLDGEMEEETVGWV